MLNEDDVVEAVCKYLQEHGYIIVQRLLTQEHGYDVIATIETISGNRQLFVEAKGATSSKEGTKRYGKEFNNNQVRTHIAVALFKAIEASREKADGVEIRTAIALPLNTKHQTIVAKILTALETLGIGIFWVNDDYHVEVVANWTI